MNVVFYLALLIKTLIALSELYLCWRLFNIGSFEDHVRMLSIRTLGMMFRWFNPILRTIGSQNTGLR